MKAMLPGVFPETGVLHGYAIKICLTHWKWPSAAGLDMAAGELTLQR